MTELDLCKFINKHDLEIDWREDQNGNEFLFLWIDVSVIEEFANLLDRCDADDGGIDCKLQNGGNIVLDLLEICNEYEINPESILPKTK